MKTIFRLIPLLLIFILLFSSCESHIEDDGDIAPEKVFAKECTDGYGNPTLYALTELSSSDAIELFWQLDYEWLEETGSFVKTLSDGSPSPYISCAKEVYGKPFSLEEYEEIESVTEFYAVSVITGYIDENGHLLMDEIFDDFLNIELIDRRVLADDFAIAIAKDSAGKRYFITIGLAPTDMVEITISTDESLQLTTPDEENGIDEAWDRFTN